MLPTGKNHVASGDPELGDIETRSFLPNEDVHEDDIKEDGGFDRRSVRSQRRIKLCALVSVFAAAGAILTVGILVCCGSDKVVKIGRTPDTEATKSAAVMKNRDFYLQQSEIDLARDRRDSTVFY